MTNLPEKKKDTRLAVLRNTVAQGATDSEFAMFLEFCKGTKLNPFKREIWFMKTKSYTNKRGETVEGRVTIMTGFNGFLAIANAHPEYDGMKTEVVRNEDGSLEYAETSVFRKDRKYPSVCRAYFKEFYKPGNFGKESQWDKQPVVMLSKCSKSHALREAFPQELGGLYTQEEVEIGDQGPTLTFEQINKLNAEQQREIVEADIETANQEATGVEVNI